MAKRPYVGATKLVSMAEVHKLGPRWVLQEKKDGEYVRVCLDSCGRAAHVFSRNDREVHRDLLDGIRGAHLGRPHAELVGELEAHTEAGRRAAKDRGQPLVHMFDCLHDGARSLVRSPYHERRDALFRMQSEVECYGDDAPWLLDEQGKPRERATGRYTYAKLTDWRVAPIVPQAPLSALGDLWERVKADDLEGLVAVNLDAPVGRPASKLKLKPYETIDAEAVQVSRTVIICSWNGHLFSVGRGKHEAAIGDIVEVRHAGWYSGAVLPRFPAIVRVRRDLQ